jgi:hypothetical protein
VLVDYVIWFRRPGGSENARVHKLKTGDHPAGETLRSRRSHRFKADATTYSLVPGPHRVALQVNGRIRAETVIDLRSLCSDLLPVTGRPDSCDTRLK